MKKSVAGLAAVVLLLAGLVGLTSTSASAAPPYPPTVTTKVIIKTPAENVGKAYKVRQRIRLWVSVEATGTALPHGTVTLHYMVKSKGKWRSVKKAEKNNVRASRKFTGKGKNFSIGYLKKKGTYKVRVVFTPTAGSVFKPSTKDLGFKVK